MSGPLLFSVVVPSLGREDALSGLLEALAQQSLSPERYEIILVLDGAALSASLAARFEARGVRIERLGRRSGPGAARNRGAAVARGEYLAFTEDDCLPDREWLSRAAARLAAEPGLDVLEGRTLKPGGRPVHAPGAGGPLHLPTNLFVRRALFEKVGGFHEAFFDPRGGIYFREDSDLGFTLEEAGARVGVEESAVVTHPEEHARALDPLRWAMRYEMDPLLARRHPRLFRQRIEAHRIGPLRIRRPVVRASFACVIATLAAGAAALAGSPRAAWMLFAVALAALLPVWAKWRFEAARLPVVALVPFVLVAAWVRGWLRARRMV